MNIGTHIQVGSDVVPIDNNYPLVCGSGQYESAVVVSLDPFILVSKGCDMRWFRLDISHYESIGIVSDETLQACKDAL